MVYQDLLPKNPADCGDAHHHCFGGFCICTLGLVFAGLCLLSEGSVNRARAFAEERKVSVQATVVDAGYEDTCAGMLRKCADGYESGT